MDLLEHGRSVSGSEVYKISGIVWQTPLAFGSLCRGDLAEFELDLVALSAWIEDTENRLTHPLLFKANRERDAVSPSLFALTEKWVSHFSEVKWLRNA